MTKSDILNFLAQHKDSYFIKYGVTKIGLFGSYAKGTATEKSDIDIFAEMPPKFEKLIHLQDELETKLQHKIDIIRLRDKMNPRLKENILRDGIYA